jgi:hypothetical protein
MRQAEEKKYQENIPLPILQAGRQRGLNMAIQNNFYYVLDF